MILKSIIVLAFASLIFAAKPAVTVDLILKKDLGNFPSASSVEIYNGKIYVIGDDAPNLLVLDKSYKQLRSIKLFEGTEGVRIAKAIKADLECSAVIEYNGKPHLMMCGSAATKKRQELVLFDLDGKSEPQKFSFAGAVKKIKKIAGEVNLEGLTAFQNKILLSNRANSSNKTNYLLLAENDFFTNDNPVLRGIAVELPAKPVTGISSLSYDEKNDCLLFTATIENTKSSYADGPIGDSFLGIINNFASKAEAKSVRPDEFINLSKSIPEIAGQKIEGLAVESNLNGERIIHLVSDNDDGRSFVFKVRMK